VSGVPAISVIIPAYNAARTIGTAVDSVLGQTFEDLELLVVDDGSVDDTPTVVEARSDPRVTVIRGANAGVSTARNRGLERATGTAVAFLDADDVWEPRKLERQFEALQLHPDAGMCFATAAIVDDELRPIGTDVAAKRADYTAALLLEGNVIAGGGSGAMVRSSVIEQVGPFDPQLSQCADWDMWLRMSVVTEFMALDEPLVLYRSAAGSMSSDPGLLERDTLALLDKFFAGESAAPYRSKRGSAYANQRMVLAGSYLHSRRLRDALRCVAAAVRDDPRSAAGLLSVPLRWADRARRRALRLPPSQRDAISRRA
jgi:glycosyltransferase involved in cell wall biosynthesis